MKKQKSAYLIQSVAHAFDILEQFRDKEEELGVTELSKRLRLTKNSIFRLLATLESRSFIEQNSDTGNYRLGPKNLQLAQTVVKQLKLHNHSMPVLKSLTGGCNETCYVAVLKGSDVVYLDTVESTLPVRIVPKTGLMLPVHCTAAGKVLLAGAIDKQKQMYPPAMEFKQYTPNTITNRNEFDNQLETIARQGYALEDEELDLGVRGVAAPIRDYTKCVVGAITVSGPAMRFSEARMLNELVPMVQRAAAEISLRIGYYLSAVVARNT